ncbi:MAG: adenylyl-sulfate kinase [Alphaproteobacteria bacterium]|nr:adenylyl-sulfate kinase [Alphaproteobacteria bacterium]
MNKGKLIWITGLAGAGKSTSAKYLVETLKSNQIYNVAMVEGDNIRKICDNDLGYSLEERKKNAWRIVKLCEYLCSQGLIVVCGTISLYKEIHEYIYTHFDNPQIIFLNISREIINQRNQKKLYTTGKSVVGMDIKYDAPVNAAFVKEIRDSAEVFGYLDQIVKECKTNGEVTA